MFVRILNKKNVNDILSQLKDLGAEPVKKCDGDLVFAAMQARGKWICRLHPEVFDPGQ